MVGGWGAGGRKKVARKAEEVEKQKTPQLIFPSIFSLLMHSRAALARRSGRLLALASGEAPVLAALPNSTTTRRSAAAPSRKRRNAVEQAAPVDKKRVVATAAPKGATKKKPAAAAGPSRDMEKALWVKGFQRVAGKREDTRTETETRSRPSCRHLAAISPALSLSLSFFHSGVDEAGRGPLAGPVVAAAAILPRDFTLPPHLFLDDSKKMSEEAREEVFTILMAHPGVSWAAHAVSAADIDRINILQATMVAMDAAVGKLKAVAESKQQTARPAPTSLPCPAADPAAFNADTDGGAGPGRSTAPADFVLVDGPRLPPAIAEAGTGRAVVKGDAKCSAIAAASVIAKVVRDRLMRRLDAAWPAYGFAGHKGYGTAAHCAALRAHGPCPQHRRTFAPVRGMVEE